MTSEIDAHVDDNKKLKFLCGSHAYLPVLIVCFLMAPAQFSSASHYYLDIEYKHGQAGQCCLGVSDSAGSSPPPTYLWHMTGQYAFFVDEETTVNWSVVSCGAGLYSQAAMYNQVYGTSLQGHGQIYSCGDP